jgi:endonuclease YncB( thermonuclease family)
MGKLIFALLLWLVCLNPQTQMQSLTATVVSVADGDTITVLDSHRVKHQVHLLAIDAPEKGQPFADASEENLRKLILGKVVLIEYKAIYEEGHISGKVSLQGKDINVEQLRAGLAWLVAFADMDLSKSDYDKYFAAAKAAELTEKGLWKDANPTPPWEFKSRQQNNR